MACCNTSTAPTFSHILSTLSGSENGRKMQNICSINAHILGGVNAYYCHDISCSPNRLVEQSEAVCPSVWLKNSCVLSWLPSPYLAAPMTPSSVHLQAFLGGRGRSRDQNSKQKLTMKKTMSSYPLLRIYTTELPYLQTSFLLRNVANLKKVGHSSHVKTMLRHFVEDNNW